MNNEKDSELTDDEIIIDDFGYHFGANILISILSLALSGLAISVLWGWFIIPIFGVAEISVPAAVGLLIFTRYFLVRRGSLSDPDVNLCESAAWAIAKPCVVLIMGSVVNIWM